MGKILICSWEKDFAELDYNFQKYGFLESAKYRNGHFSITGYKKLNICNENYYEEGNSKIWGVGAYLYKEKIGKAALKEILHDCSDGIETVQKNVIGSYFIVILSNKKMYGFTDYNSVYEIYYYYRNDRFICTNTYFHIARTVKNVGINENALSEQGIGRGILGRETPYHHVYRLKGNDRIIYDLEKEELKIITKAKKIFENTRDLTERISEAFQGIGKNFTKTGVLMTGGIDSRVTLSILLNQGLKPELLYGKGNSIITSTQKEDYEVVKAIGQQQGLSIRCMDWKTISEETEQERYLNKYGEKMLIYGGNGNVIKEFEESSENECVECGLYGEALRGMTWIEEMKGNTLEELTDTYIGNLKKCLYGQEYKKKVKEQFLEICQEWEMEPCDIGYFEKVKIFYEYLCAAHSYWCNFINMFCYNFSLLSQPFFSEAVMNMPKSQKDHYHFELAIIEKMNKNLLEIPFFSHNSWVEIDRERLLIIPKHTLLVRIKNCIGKMGIANDLRKYLRAFYLILMGDKKSLEESWADDRNRKQLQYPMRDRMIDLEMAKKFLQYRELNRYLQFEKVILSISEEGKRDE